MKNVPPSVRAALKRRGAEQILEQDGEYSQYKAEIDKIIHGGEVPDRIDKSDYNEEYQEDLSPEEQKANDRIEELGDKYSPTEAEQAFKAGEAEVFPSDEEKKMAAVGRMTDWSDMITKDDFADHLKKMTGYDDDVIRDFIDRHNDELGLAEWEDKFNFGDDEKEIDVDNLDMNDDKDIYETDEKGFVLLPKKYKKEIQEKLKERNKPQSNWYDNLDDSDEHAKHYKDAAMKVNPERAALIAAALNEYSDEADRGVITYDQLKKYGERLGLPQMSDRDLRLTWDDVHNVGGYLGYGQKDLDRSMKLLDAQSAFAEVVNQEARNRKAKGNYFPYNDEDIQEAKNKILDIIRPHEGYDLDYGEAYMTHDELNEIERLADQYHLTADDLAKLSPQLDPSGMGYRMKGWESPEVKDRNSTAKQMREMLKLAGDEVDSFLDGLDKKSYDKLVSMLKSKRM